ncbi:MAG: XTP/dITP diphosphatase [Clostridia bacterium]|jgi:XTP/dITP diphosphohydrolase|nr:XTP/dITP diphosphatase [Clostridiales bacterium]
MTKKVMVVASRNRKKAREIVEILKGLDWKVVSMLDAGADFEVVEDGTTFEENSYKKALEVMRATGLTAIADDSGLEVDALCGRPGVYSARFSGENATDASNNLKLLEMMEHVPKDKRTARFVCAATVVFPDDAYFTVRGECEGRILFGPKGTGGFGYDPLFYLPGYGKTFAQLDARTKNSISHRARAFSKVREQLASLGGGTGLENRRTKRQPR